MKHKKIKEVCKTLSLEATKGKFGNLTGNGGVHFAVSKVNNAIELEEIQNEILSQKQNENLCRLLTYLYYDRDDNFSNMSKEQRNEFVEEHYKSMDAVVIKIRGILDV